MRILHISDITFRGGGINTVLPQQVSYENSLQEVQSDLLLTSPKLYLPEDYDFNYYHLNSQLSLKKLCENKPDLAIFHSFYKFHYLKIADELIANNIPYLIKPHGGFSRVNQKKGFLKKKAANLIFFNKFIKKAHGIIYLSQLERKNSFEHNKNYYILPNVLKDIPESESSDKISGKLKILYLGRIDFKYKGINNLLKVVIRLKNFLIQNNVELNIYGFGESKEKKRLLKKINKFNLADVVKFNGEVFGYEKQTVLKENHMFILLSKTEGMPMGVLEALSHGLPCILTPGTNLSKVVDKKNAGWEVLSDKKSLVRGVESAIRDYKKTPQKYLVNSKKLAEKYLWNNIMDYYFKQYKKILRNVTVN